RHQRIEDVGPADAHDRLRVAQRVSEKLLDFTDPVGLNALVEEIVRAFILCVDDGQADEADLEIDNRLCKAGTEADVALAPVKLTTDRVIDLRSRRPPVRPERE